MCKLIRSWFQAKREQAAAQQMEASEMALSFSREQLAAAIDEEKPQKPKLRIVK